MSGIWVVSTLLQWLVITLLSVIVVALLRQHGRGVAGGEPAPRAGMAVAARLVPHASDPGRTLTIGGAPQLLVIYSSTCTPCASTQQAVEEIAATGQVAGSELVAVLADSRGSALDYLATGVLAGLPVVLLEDLPAELFPGSTPSAVALTADGHIAEVGRPHGRADLAEMAARLAATDRRVTQ
jgi:hypothetical protein